MSAVSVRYIVDDVDAAITFYTKQLGFELFPCSAGNITDWRRDSTVIESISALRTSAMNLEGRDQPEKPLRLEPKAVQGGGEDG